MLGKDVIGTCMFRQSWWWINITFHTSCLGLVVCM